MFYMAFYATWCMERNMKKFSKINWKAIIGKKQVVLATLVFILAIAVYLNWQFAGYDLALTDLNDPSDFTDDPGETSSEKNYGDAALVDTQNDSYFSEARTGRQKSRDEASETITGMLRDSQLSEEQLSEAANQALILTTAIENENKIENLIKAKGFTECITYLDGVNCNVVVKTNGLTEAEAAQIKDIILTNSQIGVENITITEVR